ncbi:DUF2057 family protein [Vibrio fluminensis]|uniref:DUF2057 family protein n=1 Tax=Vibrio fluminensis TaxID=2783614 RepID=UPI001888E1BA|nr:DUF2057 family protein [Vibrio fluminensis]
MKKWLGILVALVSLPTYSAQVNLAKGVELSVLNEEVVRYKSDVNLVEGENQLILRMERDLRDGARKEQVLTPPYVVVLSAKPEPKNLDIDLVSTNLTKIERLIESGESIFIITLDGVEITHTIEELPPAVGFMPYGDILGLTEKFNKENGYLYDSGKIRNLKQELENVAGKNEVVESAETETTLNLKIWFNRASDEEKKQHLEWVLSQLGK